MGIFTKAVICVTLAVIALLRSTKGRAMQDPMRSFNNKIILGEIAQDKEFPYLVSIQYLAYHTAKLSAYVHICGAAILDEHTLVTAAHCFSEKDHVNCKNHKECYKVVAGKKNLLLNLNLPGIVQERTFSDLSIRKHEHYDDFHYDNDIAIIRLDQPLVITPYVRSIKLINPSEGHTPVHNMNALIAGWGTTESSLEPANVLKKTFLRILTDEECAGQWGDDYHPQDMLCATNSTGRDGLVPDACQGDSGGPLVIHHKGSRYVAGIISWGLDCGYPEYPGLYTKVEYYLPWIERMRRP